MRNKPLINTIGMNLKALRWVSKARRKRHHIIRYHLQETLGKTNLIYSERKQLSLGLRRWEMTKKGLKVFYTVMERFFNPDFGGS